MCLYQSETYNVFILYRILKTPIFLWFLGERLEKVVFIDSEMSVLNLCTWMFTVVKWNLIGLEWLNCAPYADFTCRRQVDGFSDTFVRTVQDLWPYRMTSGRSNKTTGHGANNHMQYDWGSIKYRRDDAVVDVIECVWKLNDLPVDYLYIGY